MIVVVMRVGFDTYENHNPEHRTVVGSAQTREEAEAWVSLLFAAADSIRVFETTYCGERRWYPRYEIIDAPPLNESGRSPRIDAWFVQNGRLTCRREC